MLEINNVSKIFKKGDKEFVAVDSLTFGVKAGEIFGLIGTNGAGKTTTMRMIATTLRPSVGDIKVCGFDTVKQDEQVRKNIGILFGGDTGLYDRLTARENIRYFGELNGMDNDEIEQQIERLSQAFGLQDYLDRRCGNFSRGMKQKTSFARAIIHNPQVMLFDEPTSGLDILASEEVLDFIKQCKKMGKTILLSSHNMQEVEELCDRALIIDKGRTMAQGTLPQIDEFCGCQSIKESFIKLVKRGEL
mgnify:FL=1